MNDIVSWLIVTSIAVILVNNAILLIIAVYKKLKKTKF